MDKAEITELYKQVSVFASDASNVLNGLYEMLEILIISGEDVSPAILGILQDAIEALMQKYPEQM